MERHTCLIERTYGFRAVADCVQPFVNKSFTVQIKVICSIIQRPRLVRAVECIRDQILENDIPEEQAEQRAECAAFSVNAYFNCAVKIYIRTSSRKDQKNVGKADKLPAHLPFG